MAGERSQKPTPHVNLGALLHGRARQQMKPFSPLESGGVGLLRVVSVCQLGKLGNAYRAF